MIFFISSDVLAIILLLIILVIAGAGVAIAMAIKELIFLFATGLALCSSILGLIMLLDMKLEGEKMRKRSIALLQFMFLFISFGLFSIPRKIEYTTAPLKDVILWWVIPCIVIMIFSILPWILEGVVKNKLLIVSLHIIEWLFVISMLFILFWFSGAEYYHLLECGGFGCKTSVVSQEEVLVYKNTKIEEEKNELLGQYPKGTVFEIKKPLLGYFAEGEWARYKRVKWQENSEVDGFYGKFITPDGRTGYIPIFYGQDVDDILPAYYKPTKAEAYKKYHPIKSSIGIPLYEKYNLFNYKDYKEKSYTTISSPK